jgi:hypothetical protein
MAAVDINELTTEPYMKDETGISSTRNKIKTLDRQNGQEKGKH